MNYYYDIFLNFSDDFFMFYEWEENDDLEYFKKISLFQVSSKTLKNFISNNIKVNKEFLKLLGNNKDGRYVAIFADKNGAIALEFNSDGISISRSFLNLIDEVNLLEILYTIKVEKIDYEIINEINFKASLRKEDKIKLLIKTEVNSLIKKHEFTKLKYLYMEWFLCAPHSEEEMIKKMKNQLQKELNEDDLKIYNLIKLSYSQV